jgi:predicted SnoaL-like aldol condensation-catalyzing enzyme
MTQTSPDKNRKRVLAAFDALFDQRDYEAAERCWSPECVQHRAHIAPARDGRFNLARTAPSTLRELAHLHAGRLAHASRFTGNGRTHAWIAADIVRTKGGLLFEHRDVLQDEVTEAESKSGRPMFGSRFPQP